MAEHPRPAEFTFHHDTVSPGEHYFYAIDADEREAGHAHVIEQAAAGASAGHVLIKRLFVRPKDRQKGIGSGLLDDVADYFRGRELRLKPYPIEDAELDEDQLRDFYGNCGFDDFEPQPNDDWQWDAREHMTRLDPAGPPARPAGQVQHPERVPRDPVAVSFPAGPSGPAPAQEEARSPQEEAVMRGNRVGPAPSSLPMARGLWYRVHPANSLGLDQGKARSRQVDSPHVGQSGLSAFASPHHLYSYIKEVDWGGRDWLHGYDDGLTSRRVIAFHGREVGRGSEDEPLVRPEPDASCCGRIVHGHMAWSTFVRKLSDTPRPRTKWSLGEARESVKRRASGERGKHRQAARPHRPGPGGQRR